MAAFVTEDSPGGAVIVIQQGQIVHKAGYGLADLATGRLITPQTIFHLGSMGKQFTGLAIMMLAEEGKLAYDDPIGRHLPELARFGKDVTIRRLLHHTSGMPDYYEDEELYEALLDMADRPANQEALALLVERGELQATPGETFAYSNTGYEVLGSLIERVSGQPFPRFMQERVFEPVGMKNTFSLPNPDRLASPDLAHSYIRSGSQVEAYDSDPFDDLVGSGSVYSTVEDMYLYDQALTGGKLVKLSTLAEAFKSAVLNDGEETDYGFGWYFDQHAGRRYVAHDGEWLGFQSFYVRFPEQQLSVIILLNRTYDLPWIGEIGLEIAELYLKRP
jgi:CubicO group peptidase (beta-lactamase class C family)